MTIAFRGVADRTAFTTPHVFTVAWVEKSLDYTADGSDGTHLGITSAYLGLEDLQGDDLLAGECGDAVSV